MNIQDIASASALIKQELAPLAEKMGEGAQWTYEMFKRQAYVNALISLLWFVPFIFVWTLIKYFIKKTKKNSDYIAVVGFFILLELILLIGCFASIIRIIQVMFNPDYVTIQLIIETIKNTK